MATLTKDQKRAKKKKSAQKKLITKQHEENKKSNLSIAAANNLPERKKPSTNVKPDYKTLISDFSGSMEQWDELVLKTHNAFGYGFEYEDLAYAIIEKIIVVLPSSVDILNAQNENSLEDIVKQLEEKYENTLINMLSIVDKQTGAYWRGELEREDLLDYGFVYPQEQNTIKNSALEESLEQEEPVYGTHCMSCDNGKNYCEGEKVPESCPVCGEHKNFDIVDLESLLH